MGQVESAGRQGAECRKAERLPEALVAEAEGRALVDIATEHGHCQPPGHTRIPLKCTPPAAMRNERWAGRAAGGEGRKGE